MHSEPTGFFDTSRRTPPFSTTGSGKRQAFRWVCGWGVCFESLDGFRYKKASVCRILVVISEKCRFFRSIVWVAVGLSWIAFLSQPLSLQADHPVPDSHLWLTYSGEQGPGKGKHIVLIAADQEYRSEHSIPMLARVLAKHHGFHCTVLFSLNENNDVDPTKKIRWEDKTAMHNIPGLEHLEKCDLVVLFSRLITLPPEQMEHIYKYLDAGKPIIGIRTANHAFIGFEYKKDGKRIDFGEDVLGGSFKSHHGRWQQDSTRGILVEANKNHPILMGVSDIWGTSDVYRTYKEGGQLPANCTPLVDGQPLVGRKHDDAVNTELMPLPVAWAKTWTNNVGLSARVFHVTMGSAQDYENQGLRRLTVNAAYWCMHMENNIDASSNVDIVGLYNPPDSGFDYVKLKIGPRKPSFFK